MAGWSARAAVASMAAVAVLTAGVVLAEAATSQFIGAVMSRLNGYRDMTGLSRLTENSSIDLAAQAHADYMVTNNVLTHTEEPTKPGFVAADPFTRMSVKGYLGHGSAEVISYVFPGPADPGKAVDSLMNTVGHRTGILIPQNADAGVGDGERTQNNAPAGSFTVLNFGYPASAAIPTGTVVMYPPPGMTGVPANFLPATESPNPFSGLTSSSSPVTIQFSPDTRVSMSGFTIADSSGRALASTTFTDQGNSVQGITPQTFNFAVAANSPFTPGQAYTATFTGTVNGQSFSKTTHFTAGSALGQDGLPAATPSMSSALPAGWTNISQATTSQPSAVVIVSTPNATVVATSDGGSGGCVYSPGALPADLAWALLASSAVWLARRSRR